VTPPIRVLIVDDDVPTRVGISTILSSDPGIVVVGEADNGLDACTMAVELAPDLMVVDVQIPGIDGIETTRRVTGLGPTSPKGFEKNWIQTVPGKAWFAGFRFYAPTEAYFDKSWPLPDIEMVK